MCQSLAILNGQVEPNGLVPFNSSVRITCDPGYTLQDPNTHTCGPQGSWIGGQAKCIGRYAIFLVIGYIYLTKAEHLLMRNVL